MVHTVVGDLPFCNTEVMFALYERMYSLQHLAELSKKIDKSPLEKSNHKAAEEFKV